jgi:hypothetical protein
LLVDHGEGFLMRCGAIAVGRKAPGPQASSLLMAARLLEAGIE